MTEEVPVRQLRDVPRDQPHLLDYVRVLIRRKYLVAFVFLAVVACAAGYLYTAVPVYEARTRLLIDPGAPNAVDPNTVVEQAEARQSNFQTHFQLLQSRRLARKTLTELNLWDHPRLNASLNDDGPVEHAIRAARSQLKALVAPAPAAEETAGVSREQRTQDRIVTAFLSRLSVTPVQNSRLVDVTFRSSDPELAVTIVNGLAAVYISDNLDSKVTASRETTRWLTEQIEKQRAEVSKAEAALQSYRERNNDLAPEDGQNIVVQKLADLNAAVTRVKTLRLEKEAVYQQVAASADRPEVLDTAPAVLANSFIQQQRTELVSLQRQEAQLSERLGELHPEIVKLRLAIQTVQGKLRKAMDDVVRSLKSDYESALAQEKALVVALNEQKAEAQSMNRKAIEYAALHREVESSKGAYETLLQRERQTAVTADARTNSVNIVDTAAEPDVPISPKKTPIMLIALLGGVFLSVSAAFFFEYLDHRVKTPEQIETYLRLSSLGTIPMLPRKHRKAFATKQYGATQVPSGFAEAFRGLRTNVLFSSPDDGRCSIVVTSASPREGKTIVASNLAVGLAQAGHRVIMLDADLRRPRVHSVFGLDLEPGLSDLLGGTARTEQVLQETGIPNLLAVAAGSHSPNPAELVASSRFDEILSRLEGQCDVVVIDTPPVMAVADASILAHRTSGVLFVVAADSTSRHAAQAALEQLVRARGRFLGAVLNRVDASGGKYKYAPYSRAEYAQSAARSTLLH